ncbi:MAG: aminotransferase class I/II-fold pyridoxal phosphate-dependent enzyme [Clostridia bacterium]|nr:aminotransferase class I/II-fold pyridoxal phosphate-dependent enzyme [Clostridia bacterium]
MLIDKKSPHGGDIYTNAVRLDFSANINPAGMPEKVRQALIQAAESCSAYPDPYCTELRGKIAAHERVPMDAVLCGNGAAELIYQYAYTLPKGKPALIVSPTFCEYEQALCAAGIPAEYYLLREADGFRLTEEILRTDFSKYSAVYLCSPNNPTGITVEPKLIDTIAATGVRLFCDFCFLDLTDHPEKYDIPSLIQTYPNLTILRAFTKSYTMAGVRLGYVLCGDAEFLAAMSEKTQCWNVSTLAQAAGIAAMDCLDWLRDSVRLISEERKRITAELCALDIRVYPGEANYLLLYSGKNLTEPLMRRGMMVRDCSNYIGLGDGYIRIAVRTRSENDQLLTELKEVLK